MKSRDDGIWFKVGQWHHRRLLPSAEGCVYTCVKAGESPIHLIDKFSDAHTEMPSSTKPPFALLILAKQAMNALPWGLGEMVTALWSPQGCQYHDSGPKTFSNLDYIRPVACQHWSEHIQTAATLNQQSLSAETQPNWGE